MKAFLLAAGLGSRLKPLTDETPKCLISIAGKPLLSYWFALFEKYNVDQVIINLHYLPNKVRDYFHNNDFNIDINLIYEEKLLGSAGTIKTNADFVENEDEFLICYADNLTNVDLGSMICFHQSHKTLFTLGLFYTNTPQQCGIAKVDENNTVIDFQEKPQKPVSNLAGAGIYITSPEILRYIPDKIPVDIGYDVLPKLIGKMKGYLINEYFLDIGTYENYDKANKDWQNLKYV